MRLVVATGWVPPVIQSVLLPAHAQVSVAPIAPPPGPPANTGEIRVTSILWQQTASNDPDILVDEYVDIENVDSVPIDIEGWMIGDNGNNFTVTFPSRVLQPGEMCRIYVHAPPGNQACEFTFGRTSPGSSGNYVFNNSGGDSATLTDGSGTVIDSCAYTGSDANPFICP